MRVRDRRILLVTAGALAALSTAACSGSGGSGGSDKAKDTIAVSATDTACDVKPDTRQTGDLSQSGPVADQLVSDIGDLATRAKDLELQPLNLANGALGLLDEIAT